MFWSIKTPSLAWILIIDRGTLSSWIQYPDHLLREVKRGQEVINVKTNTWDWERKKKHNKLPSEIILLMITGASELNLPWVTAARSQAMKKAFIFAYLSKDVWSIASCCYQQEMAKFEIKHWTLEEMENWRHSCNIRNLLMQSEYIHHCTIQWPRHCLQVMLMSALARMATT